MQSICDSYTLDYRGRYTRFPKHLGGLQLFSLKNVCV